MAPVHDNAKLTKLNTPAGKGSDVCKPGPLMLHHHGHPVQFGNIWLVPTEVSFGQTLDVLSSFLS